MHHFSALKDFIITNVNIALKTFWNRLKGHKKLSFKNVCLFQLFWGQNGPKWARIKYSLFLKKKKKKKRKCHMSMRKIQMKLHFSKEFPRKSFSLKRQGDYFVVNF